MSGNNKNGAKICKVSDVACTSCTYRDRCCKSKKGAGRTIVTDGKEPLRQEMVEKMRLESSVHTYRNRKKIVEPVFGQIKNSGFRQFSVRGPTKVAGEFSIACIAHNIKKIIRAVQRGKVCLGSSGFAPSVM